MRATLVALIYFGSFPAIGLVAKRVIDGWAARRDIDLAEVQAQAGPRRGKRSVFLLGCWREEGPD